MNKLNISNKCKSIKRFGFSVIYNLSINILISILVGLLIIILIIISYSMSDGIGGFNEDNYDGITIDSISDNNNNSNNNNNNKNHSVFRQELYNFYNLFSKNNVTIKDKNVITNTNNVISIIEHQSNLEHNSIKTEDGFVNKEIERSVIKKKIYHLNYESANQEIEVLNDRIYLLEIQLIKYKIDRMDRNNLIESVIKDINKELKCKNM